MSREIKKSIAKSINAIGDTVECVSTIVDTFSKTFLANSKIEVTENIVESSIPGGTLQEKAGNAKETWESLIA